MSSSFWHLYWQDLFSHTNNFLDDLILDSNWPFGKISDWTKLEVSQILELPFAHDLFPYNKYDNQYSKINFSIEKFDRWCWFLLEVLNPWKICCNNSLYWDSWIFQTQKYFKSWDVKIKYHYLYIWGWHFDIYSWKTINSTKIMNLPYIENEDLRYWLRKAILREFYRFSHQNLNKKNFHYN